MARALRLAARGRGRTSPNPMVGAVVVAGHRIVGEGYHRRAGAPHAEIVALKQAGRLARGATLYLTLEPCCHTNKRTPPCVPAVIRSGVGRVVVAMSDPNPAVHGNGIRQLRKAGIRVEVGSLESRAMELNRAYVHRMKTGVPLVILKSGMSLDGQIATKTRESQWITGVAARRDAHRLRAQVDAVLVGIGTVLKDDPSLSVRLVRAERQPARVVVDSRLRIPLGARVLTSKGGQPIIATTAASSKRKVAQLRAVGAEVFVLPSDRGRVSLRACFKTLAAAGYAKVLIEGGSEINAAALKTGQVQEVRLYIAPLVLGGRDAIGLIGGRSPTRLADGRRLHSVNVRRLGADMVISGKLAQ